jgi:hypothetical protein
LTAVLRLSTAGLVAAVDAVADLVARREEQDGQIDAELPGAAAHLEPRSVRKPDVDDGHVEAGLGQSAATADAAKRRGKLIWSTPWTALASPRGARQA